MIARRVRIEVSPWTIAALVLLLASLWLLVRLWPVLLVLVAALVVAGTLSPAVRWLEEKRLGRRLGIAIVFTVFFVLALLVVALTIPTLVDAGGRASRARARASRAARGPSRRALT